LRIDSTLDGMEKSNNDLGNLVSMIDSTINDMKKNDDNPSNVVSMIDADATSTQNDDDPNEETTDIKGVSYNNNYIGTRATKYVCFNLSTVPTTYDNCTHPLHLCLCNLPHVHTL